MSRSQHATLNDVEIQFVFVDDGFPASLTFFDCCVQLRHILSLFHLFPRRRLIVVWEVPETFFATSYAFFLSLFFSFWHGVHSQTNKIKASSPLLSARAAV